MGVPDGSKQPRKSTAADLRHRRAEVSRQAIRDAVAELLAAGHPAALSIPAVAEAAGLSVRTVYRHFPTKQDLLDDVAEVQQRRADAMVNGRQDLYDNPGQYLRALWADFETDVGAVRAQHQSALGDQIRATRAETTRGPLMVRLDKYYPEMTAEDREDLADLIMTIMSSSAFLDLHIRLGRSGEDAARMAWWAVQALQSQFEADGGLGGSSRTSGENLDRADQR